MSKQAIETIGKKVGGRIAQNRIVTTEEIGELHHNTLWICLEAGSATVPVDGDQVVKLDLSFTPSGGPIVTNPENGKQYFLGWKDVIGLAIKSGILDSSEPLYREPR